MKHLSLAFGTALLFAVTSMAQTSPATDNSQGTQGSSPAMSGQSGQTSSGQSGQTGNDSSMGQGSTSGSSMGHSQGSSTMSSDKGSMKGEKKMKGCIRSEGGNYMLEEKGGKTVALAGSDVSAHAGHEVVVHGTWENGGGAAMSESGSSSSGMSKGSGKTFNVSSVDMVSESCSMGKKSKSSSMGGSDQPK
jgi:hypothetical protein